ncbi:outer membrane assembly protein AsmA [Cronobacter dublinensis]|uniref:outer membrane assembly protein AsmA n=1 Tax=Cronobacter dublinensis TaxID=413497 RepID=UPI000CFB9E50|nr:outer membrane assembly protein AsmA [Cronobacter dublinensis]EGT4358237.1 outer membrane assembly protein AsmA [Cronobacter dublinensis]MDI6475018.1 outer membrane assembly protein AsmA [Cronobacter dublinensis]
MRRVLTTLMILLVVFFAGLSALVMLVNPNDFRSYMISQVERRSGYQLKLDGPLRWHVWPQLSILSGRMSLTAPGASQPLVSADNMRLDVALFPLLSHQLSVRQVMLKGAVVQLTPQSEARREPGAPVGPKNSAPPVEDTRGWSFDIARLKVADSVLVFQHKDDEQVTVRNINLQMEQNERHDAQLELSGKVSRDQRDLTLSLSAALNAADYPQTLSATVSQLSWQLHGADLPRDGIQGEGTFQARWLEAEKRLEFSALNLKANDSQLAGQGSVTLGDAPAWDLDLHFSALNLDHLLAPDPATTTAVAQQGQQSALPRPVIAAEVEEAPYTGLRGFNASARIQADSVRWRGLAFSDVNADMRNQAGLLTLKTLSGKLGAGELSLPGTLDAREDVPDARFAVNAKNIEVGEILRAFNYPIALTGKMNVNGAFRGDRIDAQAFRENWEGEAALSLTGSRMEGLNFQQLIQQAVERSGGGVSAREDFDNATTLDSFTTHATLDHGELALDEMQGRSSLLTLSGEGTLDLVREQCDTRFKVQVTDGWQGDDKLVQWLKATPVPLRVYGSWKALNYNLQVDQLLRKHLQDEAKRRLSDWSERHKGSNDAQDVKKLLDKL